MVKMTAESAVKKTSPTLAVLVLKLTSITLYVSKFRVSDMTSL